MDFFDILFDIKNGSKMPYSKNYFDTLFAAKLKELGVKTLTGTLPLTFRTSETALRSWIVYGNDFQQEESKSTRLPLSFYTDEDKLRDWTIYGNNYEHKYSTSGTLPLTFTSHTAGAASDWEIDGNNNIGKNLLELGNYTTATFGIYRINMGDGKLHIYGKSTNQSAFRALMAVDTILPAGTYTLTGTINDKYRLQALDITKPDNYVSIAIDDGQGADFTLAEATPIRVNLLVRSSAYNLDVDMVITPMIRPADTSPDFEPYTVGVGQRTKNLLEITAYELSTQTVHVNGIAAVRGYISATGNGETNWQKITWRLQLEYGKTYTLSLNVVSSASSHYMAISDVSGTVVANLTLQTTGQKTIVIDYTRSSFPNGIKLDTVLTRGNAPTDPSTLVMSEMMLVEGSTAPESFIPYGYEIPLTVNSTPQMFYIGDTPLTAGQSISKTSTGVDIAAIAGSNTITTELYNKPSMSIEGVDYVGVGEYVNGQWQIPLTVSDGTNTTTVNVPIDAPLTASDTATKASTGVDIATADGTNTISTTLENKPQMLVYYGYKGAGEHVGNTWEFNFITSANGNQQLTRITMDKPLRAGETLTSEQAGVTIPTYADAENTLSLYPSAAGYGNPEMSITYKGG